MGKLVVIKLGDGSFEQGFTVTMQIGEDGKNPFVELQGKLPPTPEILQYYQDWASTYRKLGLRSRLEASRGQVTNVSKIEMCDNAAQVFRTRLNTWLCSESFRPLREKLLEQLMPYDEVRIIIQTENIWLRRLPWHLWDVCDRYPKAEIALSAPVYERLEQIVSPHNQVRVLAILGNSIGINTQADRLLLEELPDAEVSFLVEPQRQEFNEGLWQQSWDILFFAGHSSSRADGETGRIYINQTDSLTIDQLRYALKKAVERGLKIAIFNSCDGLGLARDLADLQIPQIIVMREPVPDRVSQEFLKYFLAAFARGESFYLAVREARERLQGLEDQFPCATWLPIIFQNPAIMPPTWQGLGGSVKDDTRTNIANSSPETTRPFFHKPGVARRCGDSKAVAMLGVSAQISFPETVPAPQIKIKRDRHSLGKVLLTSLVVTSLVLGIRQQGMLQRFELKAFDQMMRSRPAERPDNRLLLVTITEEDIQAQQQELKGLNPPRSLSDRSFARLMEKLESYQPRAIGLDIYRDFHVGAQHQDLAKRLKQSDRFFGICKVSTENNDLGIAPPPEVSPERQGFSDVVIDRDSSNEVGVLRRHLLQMLPAPASPCTARWALSAQLAFRYLAAEKISRQITSEGYLQLGNVVFKRLQPNTGAYQNSDTWGHQVLLNYRFHHSLQDFVPQVTLTQVLNGQLDPEAVKDKVVLIGVTAPSRKDYFFTPYSTSQAFDQKIPGVVVHAQMVSQILSAVLDHRPLLWVWSWGGEALWIWGWSLVGGLIAWRFQLFLRLGILVGAVVVLYGFCFGLFLIQGGWVPLVPSVLVLLCTSGSVVALASSNLNDNKLHLP